MDKQYKPRDIEQKIYESWEKHKCFLPKDSASKFSIVLPPPNVTGTLHMGHAFQHTIIDVLVRYHRMLGKSVLWQPGTDHAGIATQLVVENRISNSGINPKTLSREEFIDESGSGRNYRVILLLVKQKELVHLQTGLGIDLPWTTDCPKL